MHLTDRHSKYLTKNPRKNPFDCKVKEMDFECEICEKVFNTRDKLQKHFNYNHNNTENVFNCNICTKSFQAQKILASHIKTVHGGKCYKCASCSKSFSNAGNLNKHIYTVHEDHKEQM